MVPWSKKKIVPLTIHICFGRSPKGLLTPLVIGLISCANMTRCSLFLPATNHSIDTYKLQDVLE